MSSGLPSSDLPPTVDTSARSARAPSTRPGQTAGSTPTGDGPVFATEMKEALTAAEGSAPAAPSDAATPEMAAQTGSAGPGQAAAQTALKRQGASIAATAPEAAVALTASKRAGAS